VAGVRGKAGPMSVVPVPETAGQSDLISVQAIAAYNSRMAIREADRWIAEQDFANIAAQIPERPGQSLAEFLTTVAEAPECEVPGLLPKASRVIITGEEGAGKSTLGRFVAAHRAAGLHPFTGEAYDGGTAVLLDGENPVGLQQMRLAELRDTLPEDAQERANERLVPIAEPGGIDLAARYWQEYLLRAAEIWKASLIVLGPLYKLSASLKPMSEEFFVAISQLLDRLMAERGCALWIEAHVRQRAPGQAGRDPFPYGNTGWRRWPEAGMFLGRGGLLTDWRGNRYGTDVTWPARLDRVPGSQVLWKAGYVSALAGAEPATADEKIRQIRAAIEADPNISLTKLRVAVSDDGTWIRRAIEAGAVVEYKAPPKSGKSNRYAVSPAWTGGTTPAVMPDGRYNFQRMYEMADHRYYGVDPEG
jgi:AAA domain